MGVGGGCLLRMACSFPVTVLFALASWVRQALILSETLGLREAVLGEIALATPARL